MAKSRRRVSALREVIKSTSCTSGNSRPIAGVESNCRNPSRDPEFFKGVVQSADFKLEGSESIVDADWIIVGAIPWNSKSQTFVEKDKR